MNKLNNKWIRAAIPALLLHCSIGTVYCWSLVKGDIAQQIGRTNGEVEWAFSIAIFFLGMSAAFAGNIVEKDIKKSSLIAAFCFAIGLIITGLSISAKSLIGIYLGYGVVMGIGLGLGYLSPVKTLMLWFKEQKGLATGLAVAGFGLAKVIASPIMTALISSLGIAKMFYILAVLYFCMMLIGHFLLKKPEGWTEEHGKSDFNTFDMFKNVTFLGIWLMVYINISCGLALISQEKGIMTEIGLSTAMIGMVSSLTAIFNAGGRLGYSAASDKMKDRNTIYKILFILAIIATGGTLLTNAIDHKFTIIVIALLCIINSTYGGGFSNLPTLLADRFGMKNVSKIHGLALSAWAMAGLTGNQVSAYIFSKTSSYNHVLSLTLVCYMIALSISHVMVHRQKKDSIHYKNNKQQKAA